MRRRNDGAGASPQEEFGDVCFHALGIIDQNREYLQMHLLASADLPTRQALSDIQIESARLDRTVRNAITLYQLENEELSELQPLDLCGLLEKAGRLAPDIQRSLEITLTTESGGTAPSWASPMRPNSCCSTSSPTRCGPAMQAAGCG